MPHAQVHPLPPPLVVQDLLPEVGDGRVEVDGLLRGERGPRGREAGRLRRERAPLEAEDVEAAPGLRAGCCCCFSVSCFFGYFVFFGGGKGGGRGEGGFGGEEEKKA